MACNRGQTSKSKLNAIFRFTAFCLTYCRKSEGSPFSRKFEWSALTLFFLQRSNFKHVKCERNHSN